ncbi:MAG: lipoprotein, partial [Gammaproteobacteria bacterium]|nr:lipoprotein [Gammaproteobacteria bacterium]
MLKKIALAAGLVTLLSGCATG